MGATCLFPMLPHPVVEYLFLINCPKTGTRSTRTFGPISPGNPSCPCNQQQRKSIHTHLARVNFFTLTLVLPPSLFMCLCTEEGLNPLGTRQHYRRNQFQFLNLATYGHISKMEG